MVAGLFAGCAHSSAPAPAATAQPAATVQRPKLVAMPAESNVFPRAAKAATDSLRTAQVDGLGTAEVSKVSLEVVQLLLECVDPTEACYEAVGRSLTANGLLFAQIAPSGDDARRRAGRAAKTGTPQPLKITVTLFDVDARAPRMKAERVFASEDDATAGVAELVAEATRP